MGMGPHAQATMTDDNDLIGQEIEAVRTMTEEEMEGEFWNRGTIVLELDDGTILYPARDAEGNGPGALFGDDGDEKFMVLPGGPDA